MSSTDSDNYVLVRVMHCGERESAHFFLSTVGARPHGSDDKRQLSERFDGTAYEKGQLTEKMDGGANGRQVEVKLE